MTRRDATGEPIDDDDPYADRSGPCTICHGEGWVLEHYDAAGVQLTADDETNCAREAYLPCPRCSPRQHMRWQAGCWTTDGTHDRAACPLCIEDGRHEHHTR